MRPHLVILDLWMAERDDGWTFLKWLWGDIETTHIPTVVVTGEPHLMPVHADVLHALHCRVMGRPFDLQELLATIAAVLGPSPVQWERGPHVHGIPPADRSVPAFADYPLDAAGES